MISYVLAFSAAIVNAVSDVLNRKASREAPRHLAFRFRLFAHLLHRRAWLAAVFLMLMSFVLAASALGTGQLAAVQLIVILELPITLVGSALYLGGHLANRDWVAIVAMTAGVIGLLVLLDPEPGKGEPASAVIWLAGGAANVAVIVALYIAAKARRQSAVRAALLGIASGCGYGLTAAFTKGMASQFTAHGVGGVLTSWQIYACGVAGLASTWLLQNAYHSGTLAAAQPGITLVDPVVATLWGAAAFGEHVRHGWLLVLAALPLMLLIAGVLTLSRSPTWQRNEERPRVKAEPARGSRASLR
ncbi:MAG TPA: DMT family transporter [Streptosporangiaceae bacterium]|jgi:drug/metabolite transporter (DMT)-like permease|nr:DMT family transporter [Streptosporangiaceae bacterium]